VSLVNLQAREISIKVVYYGPGLGGKTSSLQYIHRALKPESRGQLVSLATGADRTLYFDFLPVKLPKLRGFNVRVQLYTVPGQVHYNSTRKLVLNGCDGVVFVADSQKEREGANIESLDNLRDNLREQALAMESIPLVFQWNKRDCQDLISVSALTRALNPRKAPAFETVAMSGRGIFEALKAITTEVLQDLRKKGVWEPLAESKEARVPKAAPGGITERIQEFTESPDSGLHRTGISGVKQIPATPGSLAELVDAPARGEVQAVEADITRGDYAGAIRRVGKLLRDAVADTVGADPDGGPAMVALLYRVAPERFVRMREILRRIDGGAVSSQDAAFALFFLIDLELGRQATKA
jgi:signal recognition particle receptor subunit beta